MKLKALILVLFLPFLMSCGKNIDSTSTSVIEPSNSIPKKTDVSSDNLSFASSVITASSGSDSSLDEENTYYFDSESTSSLGTKEHPFSSLDSLSSIGFSKGTHVLFKRGSVFHEPLFLENLSGEKNHPIVFSSYGEGDKPRFSPPDQRGKGVLYLKNCSYVSVSGLELTCLSDVEADRRGVLVELSSDSGFATYHDVLLDDLYIHDIHGFCDKENQGMSMASKITGGIHLYSKDGKARMDGFTVKNCRIENVSNVGIATWYKVDGTKIGKVSPYDSSFKEKAHLNVLIQNNVISHVAKNAIFVRNLFKGLVSSNVVSYTSEVCKAGNSIVTSYVDSTVVEKNEGYLNLATFQEDGKIQDGAMLDADLQSKDVIFQYNYSHDNAFGLFLNCNGQSSSDKGANDIVTVRYNLSVCDKGKKGIVYINYYVGMIRFYNNTILTGKEDTPILVKVNNGRNAYLFNNIFYVNSPSASFELGDKKGLAMEKNLLFFKGSVSGCDIGDFLRFDPIARNEIPTDHVSLAEGVKCAYFDNPEIYDASNCVKQDEVIDILSSDYSIGLGCLNKNSNPIG